MDTITHILLSNSPVWPVVIPLLSGVMAFIWPKRARIIGNVIAPLTFVSVLNLAMQVHNSGAIQYSMGGWASPLGIALDIDRLGILFQLMTAVTALLVGCYANHYFTYGEHTFMHASSMASKEGDQQSRLSLEHHPLDAFWTIWGLLWAALNALFMASDIFNIYVLLELIGMCAIALINVQATSDTLTSSIRYLLVSLLGSLFFLIGVVLLYSQYGVMDLNLLSKQFHANWPSLTASVSMILGLALKTAIFPFHFWLPPAHGNSPAPVSAILSALVVKSTFFVVLRLWLELFSLLDTEASSWLNLNTVFATLGCGAILWGSLQALVQERLKLLIAYSTVAQIGYFFLAFSLGIGWIGGLIMALSHGFAKAAMFLAAGNILHFMQHDRVRDLDHTANQLPITITSFTMAGVSIMGLPPSGGFSGKWIMIHHAIDKQYWLVAIVILLGSLLAAGYVFKTLSHCFTHGETPCVKRTALPKAMEWSAFVLALLSVLIGFFSVVIFDWLVEANLVSHAIFDPSPLKQDSQHAD